MSRIVTLYAPQGGWFKGGAIGYPSMNHAQSAIANMAGRSENSFIEEVDFTLPEGAFWTGDRISVELHRGGSEDFDGLHSGGKWVEFSGIAEVLLVNIARNEVMGAINDANTGQTIQIMPLHAGKVGFPYRNAKLLS